MKKVCTIIPCKLKGGLLIYKDDIGKDTGSGCKKAFVIFPAIGSYPLKENVLTLFSGNNVPESLKVPRPCPFAHDIHILSIAEYPAPPAAGNFGYDACFFERLNRLRDGRRCKAGFTGK